jgi:hypothetical protein
MATDSTRAEQKSTLAHIRDVFRYSNEECCVLDVDVRVMSRLKSCKPQLSGLAMVDTVYDMLRATGVSICAVTKWAQIVRAILQFDGPVLACLINEYQMRFDELMRSMRT